MDHQNSLGFHEFLLDMDFDEFIPVNNFFSGYVQALDADSHAGVLVARSGDCVVKQWLHALSTRCAQL